MPDDKLRVYVCGRDYCENKTIYAQFQEKINSERLPVILENSSCLGVCELRNRVDVKLPDGSIVMYAGCELNRGSFAVKAIGDNPLETIITANLVELTKRKV